LTYTQLTREQRYQVYILRKDGHLQNCIARELGVHPSTISRELERGRGQRGYRPKQADELASARKQKRYRARINAAIQMAQTSPAILFIYLFSASAIWT
jgi:IS30 family transposase